MPILSDTLEACQHFFTFFPKFSLKRFKLRMKRISRMIQMSDISHQLMASLVFRRKCNMLLPFAARYPREKSAPAADMPKTSKKRCTIRALACSREFWFTKHRMIRNEASAAGRSETSSRDRRPIFFLISRRFRCLPAAAGVGWGPMLSRVPALLAKAEKPIRICVTQGGTSCPQRVGPATAGRLCCLIFAPSAICSRSSSGEADPPKEDGAATPATTNHFTSDH